MILDTSKLDTNQLRCQVCIVGSGAAGITLALELADSDVDVALVTGGGYEQSDSNRKLHEGIDDPQGSHEPLDENRHRAFGGGTKVWGGRLVPFDAIDFESRSFMALSGWPIPYKEVSDRYSRAMTLCETIPDEFRQLSDSLQFDLPDLLGNGAIDTTTRERWSMPTDFGVRYREALAESNHVRILMDYHAVDLRLSDELDRIDHIRIVSRRARPLQVFADVFILATGGIENARLLLASRSQRPAGVGNQCDLVGRCYMSHIAGTHGFLRLTSPNKKKPSFYRLAKDRHGVYGRRRFRLSDRAQRNLNVGNIIGFPMRPEISDARHRDAVLSFLYLRQAWTRANRDGRPSCKVLARHASNCVFNHPLAWMSLAKQLWLYSQRPRLPFVVPYNLRAQDALFFQAEHAPNLESRILLGHQVDEFGMPRVQARIRFSEIDYRTVTEFYRQLNWALRSGDLGFVEYDEAGLEQYLDRITSRFNSVAHHFGTTRMSSDPRSGVVDPKCKVHSIRNLYVSGASVFPTSGHANPTLTIMALALRLAEHIASRFTISTFDARNSLLTNHGSPGVIRPGDFVHADSAKHSSQVDVSADRNL
jgi:choline dehydrogenase-like flavoprotein